MRWYPTDLINSLIKKKSSLKIRSVGYLWVGALRTLQCRAARACAHSLRSIWLCALKHAKLELWGLGVRDWGLKLGLGPVSHGVISGPVRFTMCSASLFDHAVSRRAGRPTPPPQNEKASVNLFQNGKVAKLQNAHYQRFTHYSDFNFLI